jgi:hypothetical protein
MVLHEIEEYRSWRHLPFWPIVAITSVLFKPSQEVAEGGRALGAVHPVLGLEGPVAPRGLARLASDLLIDEFHLNS